MFKLSDRVWWCNHGDAIKAEDEAGSFLRVADNVSDLQPHVTARHCVHCPWDENTVVTENYVKELLAVIKCSIKPLVVYGRAGQMRSAAVAIVAETVLGGFELSLLEMTKRARLFRPDILGHFDSPNGIKIYPATLFLEVSRILGQPMADIREYGVLAGK